jgi:hypothetical protein
LDAAPTRRLSAESVATAPAVTFQRASPSLAAYKATRDEALAADMAIRSADLLEKMAALDGTGSARFACNATTTALYVDDSNADLSPCLLTLTELVVAYVDLTNITSQIPHMLNLQQLKIYNTWNTVLPEELAALKQLTRLEVYSTNLFFTWPEVLQRLPQLRHLVLFGTSLGQLPPWLGKLRNLVYLDVSYNYLYHIGDELGELVKLETFVAQYSSTNTLSAKINRLTNLRVLDLRSSSYSLRLPATLAELTQLESVLLDFNVFTCVPNAVRNMPLLADTHYFDSVFSCEEIPRPIGYSQKRNDACLWDAYYGFWYKAACDGTLLCSVAVCTLRCFPFVG